MHRGAAPVVALGALMLGCGASSPSASSRAWSPAETEPSHSPPAPSDPTVAAVLSFAEAQVGKRYCWGGTGPHCFDCSGLVQAAWRSAGVKLPRTSDAQGRVLEEVPVSELRPGDILWWRHHVGLYVGGGLMVDAYHSRAGVVRRRVAMPERVLRVMTPSALARLP